MKMTRTGSPDRGGFSIIELVMVMTMILVLTSIVAPAFRVSPTRRVQNVAHQMVAHLELARTEALGRRLAIQVQFDTVNAQYKAYIDHDDNDAIAGVAAELTAFPDFGTRDLGDLVVFGRGSATVIPGDAGTDGVTLPGANLDIDTEGIPVPWGTMGTIYLVHARDNTAVSAVSVASSGAFKAWRWMPDAGEWR